MSFDAQKTVQAVGRGTSAVVDKTPVIFLISINIAASVSVIVANYLHKCCLNTNVRTFCDILSTKVNVFAAATCSE